MRCLSLALILALAPSCTGGGSASDGGAAGTTTCPTDDPLVAESFAGFCGDRVDDNCTVDVGDPEDCDVRGSGTHHLCATGDEPCPETQPASAAPVWDCTGTPPDNVVAFATLDEPTPHVATLCTYVYESLGIPGDHYVALTVGNGPDPRGPDNTCNGLFMERRFLFFTDDSPDACGPSRVLNNAPVDDQPLSTSCRKMIRRLWDADPRFTPDIQFFASSREETLAKLAVLDHAEVACIGLDNNAGEPARADLIFASQAKAAIVVVAP